MNSVYFVLFSTLLIVFDYTFVKVQYATRCILIEFSVLPIGDNVDMEVFS